MVKVQAKGRASKSHLQESKDEYKAELKGMA